MFVWAQNIVQAQSDRIHGPGFPRVQMDWGKLVHREEHWWDSHKCYDPGSSDWLMGQHSQYTDLCWVWEIFGNQEVS